MINCLNCATFHLKIQNPCMKFCVKSQGKYCVSWKTLVYTMHLQFLKFQILEPLMPWEKNPNLEAGHFISQGSHSHRNKTHFVCLNFRPKLHLFIGSTYVDGIDYCSFEKYKWWTVCKSTGAPSSVCLLPLDTRIYRSLVIVIIYNVYSKFRRTQRLTEIQ